MSPCLFLTTKHHSICSKNKGDRPSKERSCGNQNNNRHYPKWAELSNYGQNVTQGQFYKLCTAGLNSEFSFS